MRYRPRRHASPMPAHRLGRVCVYTASSPNSSACIRMWLCICDAFNIRVTSGWVAPVRFDPPSGPVLLPPAGGLNAWRIPGYLRGVVWIDVVGVRANTRVDDPRTRRHSHLPPVRRVGARYRCPIERCVARRTSRCALPFNCHISTYPS